MALPPALERTGPAQERGAAGPRSSRARSGDDRRQLPIGDYAAIGDRAGFCLVGRDGAIDWMTVPHLDGPAVFSRLIAEEAGGCFALAPRARFEAERRYIPDTNVLETTFRTAEGAVRVTDAMTLGTSRLNPASELLRKVEGLAGRVEMAWELRPATPEGGGFAPRRHGPWTLAERDGLQLAVRGWDAGEASLDGSGAGAAFELGEGDSALLAMLAGAAHPLTLPGRERCEHHLAETVLEWKWRARAHGYEGPWRDAVQRSLLAIGLLTDLRTGAIAAAGTTSLPEVLGGERNYDYRYGWVRDLSFTLDALLAIDAEEATGAALGWLLQATQRTHPRIDPVYTLAGEVLRSQSTIEASGYRDTRPVHLGNAAGAQLQLGGFGDMLEAVANYVADGHLLPARAGERLADVVELLRAIWRRPDAGLWELSERAQYTSSKLGCWAAFRRAVELAEAGAIPNRHVARWREAGEQVRAFIETELWSEREGAYTMCARSQALDCAVLLAVRRGFGSHARLRRTIEAVRRELSAAPGLLYRYSGMREQENAFLACSFWLVEALAGTGSLDDAAELMEQATSYGNDLGLFSEEVVPASGELRGNFPQALTHLALISAAASIASADSG